MIRQERQVRSSAELDSRIQERISNFQDIDREVQLEEANVLGGTGDSQTKSNHMHHHSTQMGTVPSRSFYEDESFPPNKYAKQNPLATPTPDVGRSPELRSPAKEYHYAEIGHNLQLINEQLFSKSGGTGSALQNNSDCSFTPAINNYPLPQKGKVEDRLLEKGYQYEVQKQQKRQVASLLSAQQEMDKLYDEEEVLRLQQNKYSNYYSVEEREPNPQEMRVEDRLQKRKEEYEHKLVQKRQELKKYEVEGLQSGPKIDSISQKLVAGMTVHGQKVEDRLLDYGARVRQQQEQKLKEKEVVKKKIGRSGLTVAQPKLSNMASQMKREEDVAERLYSYKNKYDEKHKLKADTIPDGYTFKPKINETSKALLKSVSRPEIKTHKKSKTVLTLATSKNLEEDVTLFRPQLSKKSLKMAERLGSASQRLLTIKPRKSDINPKVKPEEPTFQPAVNAVSNEIIKRKSSEMAGAPKKWEQLYQLDARKREEKKQAEMMKEQKEAQELKSHSFRPQITVDQNHQGKKISAPGVSLVERTRIWQENRQKKIKEKQQQKGETEVQGCTFRPTVNQYPGMYENTGEEFKTVQSIEPGSHEALMYRKSIEKFLDRQDLARKQKEDKIEDQRKKAGSGNLWKNEMTVPQSFQFRGKGNESVDVRTSATFGVEPIAALKKVIQSLHQPVMPENYHLSPDKHHHKFYPKSEELETPYSEEEQQEVIEQSQWQFLASRKAAEISPPQKGVEFESAIDSLHKKLHDFQI